MGTKGSPVPSSTRVRDGDAHHDDIIFFHPATGELWLHFHDNFFKKKIFLTKNDMNEMNEFCSWKRHEVSLMYVLS